MRINSRIKSLLTQNQYKRYWNQVKEINEKEQVYEEMSDAELKKQTDVFISKIKNNVKIEDLIVDAFSVVREASKRITGLRHFDVQLLAGLALFEGNIAEMPTGEGKTLVATCPAYLRALEKKGVHVITVNEYLAKRDFELMGPIHEFLGLRVGLNIPGIEHPQKLSAYQADVTYGVGTEFGFDYLRDNMAYTAEQKVQRPYHYAIIDEVDSVLIDEARTPLIISGKVEGSHGLRRVCAEASKTMKKEQHYFLDEELKIVSLTDEGIDYIEKTFDIDNLYGFKHHSLNHYMMQAIRAQAIFHKDIDYIIEEDAVKLVDMNTGRIMEGRSLSDGLHQAIEAKEKMPITDENKVQATVTVQNYYKMYPILSGMTGTAKTEETEFRTIYNTEVIVIPTNMPIIREDQSDELYVTKKQKFERIISIVSQASEIGRPVLIGTTSIVQSEEIADLLTSKGFSFELLNAKSVEQEVRLISMAGQKDQITIATNMAGRGTDIRLGEGVKDLGGLLVLGTEKHESRRIDNQLKGRAGRQGDPGMSKFVVSIEDDLFKRFAKDELEKYQTKFKMNALGRINSNQSDKFIKLIQQISEGINYQIREFNMKLEDVVYEQQQVVYKLRDELILNKNTISFVLKQIYDLPTELTKDFLRDRNNEDQDLNRQYIHELSLILFKEVDMELAKGSKEELLFNIKKIQDEQIELLSTYDYSDKLKNQIMKTALNLIDRYWVLHLDELMRKKDGSALRQYEQEDHTQIFKRESYQLFEEMFKKYKIEIATVIKVALKIDKEV